MSTTTEIQSCLVRLIYVLERFSTSLYRDLRKEVLTLPRIRRLTELSSSLNLETGLADSTITYLKARFKDL
ncbi:Hypothetical protein FKW44_010978, partial [Caligus rogercresseyi]